MIFKSAPKAPRTQLFLTALIGLWGLSSPYSSPARAELPPVELMGVVGYNINQFETPPSIYRGKENAMAYGFLGKMDLGPGQIETGFLFTQATLNVQEPFGFTTISGTYWMLPLLYRYTFLAPFFSVAAGFDYALVGTRGLTVSGASLPTSTVGSGFRGHWGLEFSFQAAQDLGENLSLVLDVRRRQGLADAIALSGEGTRLHFTMVGLALQKRLE
jgi:hypothetical protein